MIPKVVAGFHIRDDDWVLPIKLRALSQFCEKIVVMLDRSGPGTLEICRQYPQVEVYAHQNTRGLADEGPDGPICEEGIMRQEVWDILARDNPEWIVLGDADEIPTPDIIPFLENAPKEGVDLYYLHWVQLYKTADQHISGTKCVWSYQYPQSAKKGAIVRFDPIRHAKGGYKYRQDMYRHTRLEPSPISQVKHSLTPRQVLVDYPRLIHWKWVNWPKWDGSFQANLPKYQKFFDGMELATTPKDWLWL